VAKLTALGDSFFVGSIDLSGDIGAITAINASRAVIDVSAINQSGYDRLLGRADGNVAFNAYYNPAGSNAVFNTLGTANGTASTIITLFGTPGTVGTDAFSMEGAQVNWNIATNADLSVLTTVEAQSSKGHAVEYTVMLTNGRQTISSAGTVTPSFDHAAATTFGAAAYLHVFALTSGTATVKVQDSADNSTFADVTGLTFTAVTGATYERIATSATATIRRYLRVVTTGTFSTLDCAVSIVVYPTSQT